MEPRTRRLEIRLTEDEYQALERVAKQWDRTVSYVARTYLQHGLNEVNQ
jgi:predicted DNA-binding protein